MKRNARGRLGSADLIKPPFWGRIFLTTLGLILAGAGWLGAQIPDQPKSAIDRKIDITAPALPEPVGVTFWYEKKAYHGGSIVSARADGTTVTIRANGGLLEAEWKKLAPEAKAQFFPQYRAAVDKVNAEVEAAMREEREKSELAAGIRTYRRAVVLGATADGLLLSPADGSEEILLKGHPLQAKLAAEDRVSFKAKDDGVYKAEGGEEIPALKYVGGVKE
ncbi:hypothetical protein BH09VER1_BH09VER1_36630 [soil metagenome]